MDTTATIVHAVNCPKRFQSGRPGCDCRKRLRTYKGGGPNGIRYVSCKTRSWEKAEDFRAAWLDPKKQVTVNAAVIAYIKDMRFRLGETNTVKLAQGLLAFVEDDAITRNGHLLAWLDEQYKRTVALSEITPQMLMDWRNSWTCCDLTAYIRFTTVKSLFLFCVNHGWIPESPARNLKRPKYQKGNRTSIFTDTQYAAILAAAHGNQKLETFLELLRWSGMAIVDAVEFRQESIDKQGVLKYRRVKTDSLATVPLPEHVLALLRVAGEGQPFRRPAIAIDSDIAIWRKELQALFTKAGITTVKTEVGERQAHPHMLRDTFAVSMLRHGAKLHTVSKMLGHSSVKITEHSYLPWVTELEQAHIDDAREAVARATPKPTSRVVRMVSTK